jgi:hypothetical protein
MAPVFAGALLTTNKTLFSYSSRLGVMSYSSRLVVMSSETLARKLVCFSVETNEKTLIQGLPELGEKAENQGGLPASRGRELEHGMAV